MKISKHPFVWQAVFLFSFIITGLISGYAQKADPPLSENPWHIQELNEATGNFYSPSSFKKSIIYLNDGAIGAVQFNREEWGAVRINQQGKIVWQVKVKGLIAGIGRRGDDILLFCSDEKDVIKTANLFVNKTPTFGFSKTISAVLVNGTTGKKIQEKVVFDNGQDAYIDSRILIRPDGTFISLLVRVSNSEKSRMDPDKELKERLTSAKLSLLELQTDLSVKTIDIKAAGKEGLFLGSQVGKNDDFFFCSILDDQLIVERFQQSGVATGKLSTPLAVRSFNIKAEPVTAIDPFDPEVIFVGLHYRNKGKGIVNQVFGFNFSTKKIVGTGEEELDKSYRKSLEVNEIRELQKGSLVDMDALKVIDIVATKDKITVIKEIQFTQSSAVNSAGIRFRNDVLVVSIYDRQWKLLKTITLDKKYEANMPVGRSIGILV